VWKGGDQGEPELLAGCYRRALELAAEQGVKSVAFPSISTGVYGYPKAEAAAVAVRTVRKSLDARPGPIERVVFCAFSEGDAQILKDALAAEEGR
jgi:O-acetyl-ADP-ribose deacetylase (regulator of RNase III)